MGRSTVRTIAAGLCFGLAASPCAAEEAVNRWSAWTGLSAGPDYVYGYVGTGLFVAGDADRGGLVARLGLGGGGYRTTGDDPHDVVQYDANLLLGYRANVDGAAFAFYAGGDVNRHDNKDSGASPRGTEWGVKGLVEAYAPLGGSFYLAGYGTYSTAFETFSADLKLAYRVTETLSIGPEAGAVGAAGFAQGRAGLSAAWKLKADAELSGAAGAGWDLDDADMGFYGLINLYAGF
ncbi:MAG: cellulose biosynthesis protein BcsS [Rhizobiales bacterium]|nr:cellulose biosynthesis protein BcsS [Hyphomicrobiales bacterium]